MEDTNAVTTGRKSSAMLIGFAMIGRALRMRRRAMLQPAAR